MRTLDFSAVMVLVNSDGGMLKLEGLTRRVRGLKDCRSALAMAGDLNTTRVLGQQRSRSWGKWREPSSRLSETALSISSETRDGQQTGSGLSRTVQDQRRQISGRRTLLRKSLRGVAVNRGRALMRLVCVYDVPPELDRVPGKITGICKIVMTNRP